MRRKEIRILRAAFNEDCAERWQEVNEFLLDGNEKAINKARELLERIDGTEAQS